MQSFILGVVLILVQVSLLLNIFFSGQSSAGK